MSQRRKDGWEMVTEFRKKGILKLGLGRSWFERGLKAKWVNCHF